MTKLLINLFIKDSENIQDASVRENYGVLAGFVGIACNLFLFALKITIGMLTRSISVTADAVNNLSDGLSSVISIIGFKISSKAPDREHPFGYGRTEYIAGLVVSILILVVGVEFIKTSFGRIIHPEPVAFNGGLLIILAASLLIKLWMGLFNRYLGRKINSTVLLATMQDSINDVITTSVVIIGMLASKFTSWPVDGYIGLLVAGFILYSGFNIAKDTLSPLLGQPADPETVKQIEDILAQFDEIVGVHDLIIHNYGVGKSLASIHVEVPDTADFVAIHEIVDLAEKMVWQKTKVYLVIHMDPISMDNAQISELRQQTFQVLTSIDSSFTMHDFRVVDGQKQINLIFDVVVSYEYTQKDIAALKNKITEALKKIDERYNPVIVFDHQM